MDHLPLHTLDILILRIHPTMAPHIMHQEPQHTMEHHTMDHQLQATTLTILTHFLHLTITKEDIVHRAETQILCHPLTHPHHTMLLTTHQHHTTHLTTHQRH